MQDSDAQDESNRGINLYWFLERLVAIKNNEQEDKPVEALRKRLRIDSDSE